MSDLIEHLRFAQPAWLLLLIPAILLCFLRNGIGSSSVILFPHLSHFLAANKAIRQRPWHFRPPLALFALSLAIITLARPVWRDQIHDKKSSGIDIMIAFDLSLSMSIDDFNDKGKVMRRLEVAKRVVDDFISRRPDDRLGLVAFAGRPRQICPITMNHEWLRDSLDQLKLNDQQYNGTIRDQGTAIGSSLAAAGARLDARDSKSKIIVLLTDGANNSGKIDPVEAARNAKVLGIKIYTVAIGTKEGRVSRTIQRFPRQEFDLPTLKKIAEITGGEHYWAQNLSELESTFKTIDKLEKVESKSYTIVEDTELFMWPLAFTLLSALIATIRMAKNSPLARSSP